MLFRKIASQEQLKKYWNCKAEPHQIKTSKKCKMKFKKSNKTWTGFERERKGERERKRERERERERERKREVRRGLFRFKYGTSLLQVLSRAVDPWICVCDNFVSCNRTCLKEYRYLSTALIIFISLKNPISLFVFQVF